MICFTQTLQSGLGLASRTQRAIVPMCFAVVALLTYACDATGQMPTVVAFDGELETINISYVEFRIYEYDDFSGEELGVEDYVVTSDDPREFIVSPDFLALNSSIQGNWSFDGDTPLQLSQNSPGSTINGVAANSSVVSLNINSENGSEVLSTPNKTARFRHSPTVFPPNPFNTHVNVDADNVFRNDGSRLLEFGINLGDETFLRDGESISSPLIFSQFDLVVSRFYFDGLIPEIQTIEEAPQSLSELLELGLGDFGESRLRTELRTPFIDGAGFFEIDGEPDGISRHIEILEVELNLTYDIRNLAVSTAVPEPSTLAPTILVIVAFVLRRSRAAFFSS